MKQLCHIHSLNQLQSSTTEFSCRNISTYKFFEIMFYNNLEFNKDKDHIMQWNSEY